MIQHESARWDRRYASGELLWSTHASNFLEQAVLGLESGRALDLACGQGRNAVWLAERGWQVTGVDFSSVGIEQARQLAAAQEIEVEWIEADLLDFTPEPQGFDLVLMFYLQVPQEERRRIIRAAASAVRPRGSLLLVGHDADNLEHGHGGPQNPDVLYSAQDIAADLEGSGLTIQRAERVERRVRTPEGERTALDALVQAQRP